MVVLRGDDRCNDGVHPNPWSLFTVPDVTAHPPRASVPSLTLLYNGPLIQAQMPITLLLVEELYTAVSYIRQMQPHKLIKQDDNNKSSIRIKKTIKKTTTYIPIHLHFNLG